MIKPQQAEPRQGTPADALLAARRHEQQGREKGSHAEWVEAFRHAILEEKRSLGDLAKYHSPVEIIHSALSEQVQYIFSNDTADKQRGEFFAPILHAWEIIAYEHYGKGSVNTGDLDRHYAGLSLDAQFQRAKARHTPHPEIITLADPLQVRIIDAAAEAVQIPHRRGQTEFAIPEKLWDFEAQVNKANAEWERRRR
jgi:hypothetical protein